LSAGAKGGVAAGVVLFVLAVGGLVYLLWILKRKKRARAAAAAAAESDDVKTGDDGKGLLPPEADAGFGVHELAPRDRKPELDSMVVSELGGGGGKPSELGNTAIPAELSADTSLR
jgi:cbb3-type cytochrome oxidase subunit 3